jgi:trk system potassium uptake protein TrkA
LTTAHPESDGENMAGDKMLFVIVIGCGRLGANLASGMSAAGHSVVAVDSRQSAFDALDSRFSGYKIEGDATEFAVLQQAKTVSADLVVAVTDNDNVNLMAAQIAATVFKVPRVVARIEDPRKEDIYRALGIETICPATLAGRAFMASLESTPPKGAHNA